MDESGYAAGELVCTVSPEARRNIAQGAKPSWGRAGGLSGRWPSLLRPRIVRRRSFRFARPPHAPGLELVHYPSLTRGWREIPEVYTWFTIANPMIFSRAPAVMHGGQSSWRRWASRECRNSLENPNRDRWRSKPCR